MGKYLWFAAGVALVTILALYGWQWTGDGRSNVAAGPAEAAAVDTKPESRYEVAPEPEAPPTPAPAASEREDMRDLSEAELRWRAVVALPESVQKELVNSRDPVAQDILERNERLAKRSPNDTWGPDMQGRLNEFFESIEEDTENMLITVACGEPQCQIQIVSPGQPAEDGTPPSQRVLDQLREHWWFREQPIPAQTHLAGVDSRLYQVQYFDRRP